MEDVVGAGRYAPSPSGPLHIGNLRTAVIAWAWARTTGRQFFLRVEDIDPGRTGAADQQRGDLESLGLDWDGDIIYQSQRLDVYEQALEKLRHQDLLFECYCSRREVREAASAPHVVPGHYPGTCRDLPESIRNSRRAELQEQGRVPALRLNPTIQSYHVTDMLHGLFSAPIDALVLRRNDGGPAYNLAVVVDDAAAGIDQAVRGDDLLGSAPAQAYVTELLGSPAPIYGHVPLVLSPTGVRLAKRDGAVTMQDLSSEGWSVQDVLRQITGSLGTPAVASTAELLQVFDPSALPQVPFVFDSTTGLVPQLSHSTSL